MILDSDWRLQITKSHTLLVSSLSVDTATLHKQELSLASNGQLPRLRRRPPRRGDLAGGGGGHHADDPKPVPAPGVAARHPQLRPPLHLRQPRAPRPQRAHLPLLPAHVLGGPRRRAHRVRRDAAVGVRDRRLAAVHRGAAERPRRRRPRRVQRQPRGRLQRAHGHQPAGRRRRAVPRPRLRRRPQLRLPARAAVLRRRRLPRPAGVLQEPVPADEDDADRRRARPAELPRPRRAQGHLLPAHHGRRRRGNRHAHPHRRRRQLDRSLRRRDGDTSMPNADACMGLII